MTNSRSPNPARLREIRRLAGSALGADPGVPVTRARQRRVFGPLFYSTLVFGVVGLLLVGALRIGEWSDGEVNQYAEIDPEKALGAGLVGLGADAWQSRVESAKALGILLQRHGRGGDASGLNARAVAALRKALGDRDARVRAAGASALGAMPRIARPAKNELITVLTDDDSTVRLAAAQALLMIGDDAKVPALRALGDLVADTTPHPERTASLETMLQTGTEGQAAAVAAFVRRLSNVDDPIGEHDISNASLFEPQMLWPALGPLLKSDDPRRRTTAALAAVSVSWPRGAPAVIAGPAGPSTSAPAPAPISPETYHQAFAILELAVSDPSLDFDLRELALKEFSSVRWAGPLHRCGLRLARQLELPDTAGRVNAARLLHLIDPDSLAGINVPDENP